MKKLTDLRPCDQCDGVLRGGMFYVVRYSIAVVNRQAVNEFMGMHQFFGGQASAALVENFAPSSARAVVVAMDAPEYDALQQELVICGDCYLEPLDLPRLSEKRQHAIDRAAQPEGSL